MKNYTPIPYDDSSSDIKEFLDKKKQLHEAICDCLNKLFQILPALCEHRDAVCGNQSLAEYRNVTSSALTELLHDTVTNFGLVECLEEFYMQRRSKLHFYDK